MAQPGAGAATSDGGTCGTRRDGDTRPRIGLALGGGGARGIAHISVLRTIEELHIPIDCVAGTSAGALVGGLYASGMSVDDMEKLVLSTDWKRLFDDSLERPERSFRRKQDDRDNLATIGVEIKAGGLKLSPGLLQGERILAMFERATQSASAIDDFDHLPIPFRAVATDLNTGEAVVLDHGPGHGDARGVIADVCCSGRLRWRSGESMTSHNAYYVNTTGYPDSHLR